MAKPNTKNTLSEINEIIERSGANGIFFLDDDFLANRERAADIIDGLSNMGVKWSCEARADYLNDQLVKSLKDHGYYKLCIGAESGSQKIFGLMNKCLKIEDIKRTATLLSKYELNSEFYFMMVQFLSRFLP